MSIEKGSTRAFKVMEERYQQVRWDAHMLVDYTVEVSNVNTWLRHIPESLTKENSHMSSNLFVLND